ncbi:hypothetical protein CC80DRAFT_265506 [Byssothecium circinans]|uniref:Uncharacterized protein n=1 Tax=Byssothecium circinans TaxID=147558 RepID=A0A6A5UA59_9PLEO|nr:hypothetical protein CC80DRAFT_265506 [Byssothecium circinans]
MDVLSTLSNRTPTDLLAAFRQEAEPLVRLWLAELQKDFDAQNSHMAAKRYHVPDTIDSRKIYWEEGNKEMPPWLLTWNRCRQSCFTLFQRLKDRLAAVPEFSHLEWVYGDPKPNFVMGWAENPRLGQVPQHDFFRVTATDGSKFVLDFTAWQFGFRDWAFVFEDYEAMYLRNWRVIPRVDEEMARMLSEEMTDEPDRKKHVELRRRIGRMGDEEMMGAGDWDICLSDRL